MGTPHALQNIPPMKSPRLAILIAFLSVAVAEAEQVVISEIMYNPSGTKPEYIEIKNIAYAPRDIVKWKFTDGVTFEFPDFNSGAPGDAFMKPVERIIISSSDAATTRAAYGISAQTRVFGPWVGNLSNTGEKITLCDKNNVVVATVNYKTGGRWPKAADGTGHSLMLINENNDIDDWHNWQASQGIRGPSTAVPTTVVNYTDTWEYNLPSSDPGTGWRTTTGSWGSGTSGSGPGFFGYEGTQATIDLIAPFGGIQTPVGNNGISQYVYLFRKSFTFNGNPSGATFSINHMVDDGVTYYLNGNLLGSVNHTPGAWNNSSIAGGEVAGEVVAAVSGNATGLIQGSNILSAEVHQTSAPNSDMIFGAKLLIQEGGIPGNIVLRLSEVHFDANGKVDWVELQNTSGSSQSVTGMFLASKGSLSDKVVLSGSVPANVYQSFSIPNGGFETDANGNVNIFFANAGNHILGAAELTKFPGRDSLQAVYPVIPSVKPAWQLLKTSVEWFSTTTATQNAANAPTITSSVVINEIMCDPISEQGASEYIELYNKSGSPVSVAGWKLRGGVDFDFPAGTTIPAAGFLVVGGNKAYLQTIYGGAAIVGDWSGRLSNKGEYLRLTDQYDNLADEVDYKTGGDWPDVGTFKGSSMELINPDMDNNRASAWRASDESSKGTWQAFSVVGNWTNADPSPFTGGFSDRFAPNQGLVPQNSRQFFFHGTQDAHLIIRNINFQLNGSGGNLMQNSGSMSNNGNSSTGWLAQGTHGFSFIDGNGLNLVTSGQGNSDIGKHDSLEITIPSMSTGQSYTLSFEARWVYGNPNLFGVTHDRSIGGAFRLPVPTNLGTPGASNSRLLTTTNIPPQVDSVMHSPAVPKSTDTVKVTARVTSVNALTNVRVYHRNDDVNVGDTTTGYSTTTMVDNGTGGDAVSGDGIYTASITSHQEDGRIVQFYVRADTSAQNAVSPPNAVNTRTSVIGQPAMWMVDNRTMPNDARQQRFIIPKFYYDVLLNGDATSGPGYTSKHGYRYPRTTAHYHPLTYIAGENTPYYSCEVRGGGSSWHRVPGGNEPGYPPYSNLFRRVKWKLPNDRLFRGNSKLYSDIDLTKNNGLDNALPLYQAYLLGYPAANLLELGIHTAINNQNFMILSETEMTDNDLVNRCFENGADGELHKLTAIYNWNFSWANSYAAHKWQRHWPLRTRQMQNDYYPLAEMLKTIGNPASTREQLDRVMDSDMFFLLAAARGYAGDWDSTTYNSNNGFLYQRPSDNRWISLHWDGDSAYEGHTSNTNTVENAAQIQLTNYFNKPYNRRIFNYYLTEILNKYSKGSNRITTWIDLQYNTSPSVNTLIHNTVYGPYGNQGFDHGGGYLNFNGQYVNFFILKEQRTLDAINSNPDGNGTSNAYNTSFSVNSPGNGSSTGNATVNFTGTAPSSAYTVAIDNHPETVFNWTNQTTWTLDGVVLKTGSNNLAVRMLDKSGAQVGSTINWTVNKTGNAAPFMKLDAEPDQVKLGEVLVLDASTSVDPDSSALTFGWVSSPASGFSMTTPAATPANSKREVIFSTPGIYSFTATGNDGSTSTPITREVAVANSSDYETFTTPVLDTSVWTIGGMEIKSNTYPSRWYSLYDVPGMLVMEVSESSSKNLTHGNNQPTLLRNIPAGGDVALLTELTLGTRKSGNFFAGLYLETNEAEGSVKYAFGVENGNQLIAKRLTSGGITNLGSAVTSSIENVTKLRIRRVGNDLRFERRLNGVWSATLFTQTLTGAQTLSKGGVFLSTSAAENAGVMFDYIMLVNPANTPPAGGLKITELMYNPRETGDLEYIEVKNTSGSTLDLNGMKFTNGITLNITTSITMAAGETAVFVESTSAFQAKYPGVRVLAQWTDGSLNNDGERLVLKDLENNIIHDFTYSDRGGWPTYPDGEGGALEVVNTSGDYSLASNWRSTEDRPGGGVDTDGDGIPDAWESKFGTSTSDPLSKPRATTSVNGSNQTQISWGGVNGQNYRVQYCDNLGDAWQTVTGASSVPGVNGTVSFTDPQLPRPTKRFYRIMAL